MDYAQDGNVNGFDEHDIADASEWDGDALEFLNALVKSGFMDKRDDGIFIHDWDDYVGNSDMSICVYRP
ncbi:hypothetical protein FACS1894120_4330 [Clostridia bacterium]|nr:hypothetical protein FACS1894120_4330 [Clostridia bacterium]